MRQLQGPGGRRRAGDFGLPHEAKDRGDVSLNADPAADFWPCFTGRGLDAKCCEMINVAPDQPAPKVPVTIEVLAISPCITWDALLVLGVVT
jgi:hypothetical protein